MRRQSCTARAGWKHAALARVVRGAGCTPPAVPLLPPARLHLLALALLVPPTHLHPPAPTPPQILLHNASNYSKGLLSEILDFVMGQGLIPADGEVWKVRRRCGAAGRGFVCWWAARGAVVLDR